MVKVLLKTTSNCIKSSESKKAGSNTLEINSNLRNKLKQYPYLKNIFLGSERYRQ